MAKRECGEHQCGSELRLLGVEGVYYCIRDVGHEPELWHQFIVPDEDLAATNAALEALPPPTPGGAHA